jgi:hypothetical protein
LIQCFQTIFRARTYYSNKKISLRITREIDAEVEQVPGCTGRVWLGQ